MNSTEEIKSKANNPKAIREFGYVLACGVIAFAGVLPLVLWKAKFSAMPWIISGCIVIFAWVAPRHLKYVYIPWMHLAEVLGFINTRIILLTVFVPIFVPIAAVFRIIRFDPLGRKQRATNDSYRKSSTEIFDPKSMEGPF